MNADVKKSNYQIVSHSALQLYFKYIFQNPMRNAFGKADFDVKTFDLWRTRIAVFIFYVKQTCAEMFPHFCLVMDISWFDRCIAINTADGAERIHIF